MSSVEEVDYRGGYDAALEDVIKLLLHYSDEDGEVTEGRGIIAAVAALSGGTVTWKSEPACEECLEELDLCPKHTGREGEE